MKDIFTLVGDHSNWHEANSVHIYSPFLYHCLHGGMEDSHTLRELFLCDVQRGDESYDL
jgi:hypothetical protein